MASLVISSVAVLIGIFLIVAHGDVVTTLFSNFTTFFTNETTALQGR